MGESGRPGEEPNDPRAIAQALPARKLHQSRIKLTVYLKKERLITEETKQKASEHLIKKMEKRHPIMHALGKTMRGKELGRVIAFEETPEGGKKLRL